jgi:hypothetical protein
MLSIKLIPGNGIRCKFTENLLGKTREILYSELIFGGFYLFETTVWQCTRKQQLHYFFGQQLSKDDNDGVFRRSSIYLFEIG